MAWFLCLASLLTWLSFMWLFFFLQMKSYIILMMWKRWRKKMKQELAVVRHIWILFLTIKSSFRQVYKVKWRMYLKIWDCFVKYIYSFFIKKFCLFWNSFSYMHLKNFHTLWFLLNEKSMLGGFIFVIHATILGNSEKI